jgi:hypothetical protein
MLGLARKVVSDLRAENERLKRFYPFIGSGGLDAEPIKCVCAKCGHDTFSIPGLTNPQTNLDRAQLAGWKDRWDKSPEMELLKTDENRNLMRRDGCSFGYLPIDIFQNLKPGESVRVKLIVVEPETSL